MPSDIGYHEENLSDRAKDLHRCLATIQEELEAVDWYNQRMDATEDEGLRALMKHNRDEELEHAAMGIEWVRRQMPEFDEQLRTYLFTTAPVDEVEEGVEGGADEGDQDLGIGKLS